jgi:anti-sigma28 factor (negative regulator of flagellin synthesis)
MGARSDLPVRLRELRDRIASGDYRIEAEEVAETICAATQRAWLVHQG